MKKTVYMGESIPINFKPLVRMMKLCILFVIILNFSGIASTRAQMKRVSLDMENVQLGQILKELKKQTGLRFFYNEEKLQQVGRREVNVKDKALVEVLDEILMGTNLTYTVLKDVVVIKDDPDRLPEVKEVRGVVRDKEGMPIPGVSVMVKGTTVGVATDIEGKFVLRLADHQDGVLVFSFLGMKTVERKPGNEQSLEIIMEPIAEELEDVVVIGYGTKSQRNLTSAISTLKADQLIKGAGAAANTFDNMLGGAIKGVMVTQNSGTPGAAANINIRGVTSPMQYTSGSTNEPLYVIDGVPFFNEKGAINPMSTIAPVDIESIDVLKDAAATSIYGSRGANGVVIIKTKGGRRNEKMTISAGYTFSIGNPIKKYTPLNTAEFKDLQELIIQNSVDAYNDYFTRLGLGATAAAKNPVKVDNIKQICELTHNADGTYTFAGLNEGYIGTENTNWVREVQNKNAQTHQYNLAIRGGGETTTYSFSFHAVDQEGLYINDQLNRYGARLSLDSDISKRIKAGANLNYVYSKYEYGGGLSSENNTKDWVVRPDIPVYDEKGQLKQVDATFSYGAGAYVANPVALHQNDNNNYAYQFSGSSYLDFEVIKNLKIHGDINLHQFQNNTDIFLPLVGKSDLTGAGYKASVSTMNTSQSKTTNTSINFRADYKLILEKHQFNAMVGYGWDRYFYNSKSSTYEGFPDDDILNDIQSAYTARSWKSSETSSGLNSVYGRVGYIYDDKYLAEVNFRSDASSKFGQENKRAYFPSISMGWRMNNEQFLADVEWMNDLKARFSWGQTGSTNLADFSYIQFFSRGSSDLWGGEATVNLKSTMPNQNVKWEMTTEYNGGLDFAFFNHRLFGSIDGYARFTKGALAPTPVPLGSGYSSLTSNLIDMSNKGLEVEIGGDIIRRTDWSWSSRFNIAFNRNKIEKLNGANLSSVQMDSYIEGEAAGTLKGYRVEKIFQPGDEHEIEELNAKAQAKGKAYYRNQYTWVGDYKFVDVNGDDYISTDDRVVIASPEPKFFGGFFNSVNWKGLNLAIMFQFSHGARAYWGDMQSDVYATLGQSMQPKLYRKSWSPANTHAQYARLVYGDPSSNSTRSDIYTYSTSYLRLKNITLSYDLPHQWLQRVNVQGAQFFVSASNIWTLTSWPGIDPETTGAKLSGTGNQTSNTDPYPLSKNFSLGLKIQF